MLIYKVQIKQFSATYQKKIANYYIFSVIADGFLIVKTKNKTFPAPNEYKNNKRF
jgi:hypothetical protein